MNAETNHLVTQSPGHRVLILGLGNPILGDDGVGWRVANECAAQLRGIPTIEVDCVSLGGISLMERLIGYERAILVDAIVTGQQVPGTIVNFLLDELPDPLAGHTSSAHDATLKTAIQFGKRMGARLPDRVDIVAIEAERVYDFSEQLSPRVAAAVPLAVETVMRLLSDY